MAEHVNESSSRVATHWAWFVALIAAPLVLVVLTLFGLGPGSPISLPVAETTPRVALGISFVGLAAAVFSRRRAVIGIAAVGMVISASAYALLWWLSRT